MHSIQPCLVVPVGGFGLGDALLTPVECNRLLIQAEGQLVGGGALGLKGPLAFIESGGMLVGIYRRFGFDVVSKN